LINNLNQTTKKLPVQALSIKSWEALI